MNPKLTIKDSRNGKTTEIPIKDGTVSAADFAKTGLRVFDPAFTNTAVARSNICFIDGDKGVLSYRGYAIEVG